MSLENSQFFDINQIPKQAGLLMFGISMSRIGNTQTAEKCFEYMEHFIPKIIKPQVGLNIIYGDSLYYNSTSEARELKKKYEPLIHSHKHAFMKLMEKHPLYIQNSVNFFTWSQLILESKDFFRYLSEIKRIYTEDKTFQSLVNKDITSDKPTDEEVDFILEEILMFYLVSKGKVTLKNEFVQEKHKWILWCYPGTPLYSEVYLYHNNLFKLDNPTNTYQNSYYDLQSKKLYDYTQIDLAKIII